MRYIFALLGFLLPSLAHAHVKYLAHDIAPEQLGFDSHFLLSTFKDPMNIGLMVLTIGIIIIIAYTVIKTLSVRDYCNRISQRAATYSVFVPAILRLALGITLVGAGAARYLLTPALQGFDIFSTIQILVGFFIMLGLFVIPASFVALVIYTIALFIEPYMIGNLDFAAIAVALIILDNEKPGFDDLFGLPKLSPLHALKPYVPLILRIGVGVAMIFLGLYEKILNPHMSELIVQQFDLQSIVPVSASMWVLSAGIIEVFVGLSILLGVFMRTSIVISFIVISLSFFYFGEDVASHVTLFCILAVLFVTGTGHPALYHLWKKHTCIS